MSMYHFLSSLVLIGIHFTDFGKAATICDEPVRSQVYMIAFTNLTTDDPLQRSVQQVIVTSLCQETTKVSFYIPHLKIKQDSVLWAGNDYKYEVIAPGELGVATDEKITQKGILIVSAGPIRVHANKAAQGTGDGYLAHPVSKHSTRFVVPSFDRTEDGHSTFAIAAIYNDTCVEAWAWQNGKFGRILSLSMNEFDVYHAYSLLKDYTGTVVNSTRPISVLSGHECATVPYGIRFCDHLVEQIVPVDDLGVEYLVGPIDGRMRAAGYTVRVVAAHDQTSVDFTNFAGIENKVISDIGLYAQFNSSDAMEMSKIKCSKPCLVAQYNSGMRLAGYGDVYTDPYMTIVTPISKLADCSRNTSYGTAVFWHKNEAQQFNNYITLMARTSEKASVTSDTATLNWEDNSVLGWSFATASIQPGLHYVNAANDAHYAGYVYGHAGVEPTAYGYSMCYQITDQVRTGTWFTRYNDAAPGGGTTPAPVTGGGPTPATPGVPGVCTIAGQGYIARFANAPKSSLSLTLELKVPGPGYCGDNIQKYMYNLRTGIRNYINAEICMRRMCGYRSEPIGVDSIDVQMGATGGDSLVKTITVMFSVGTNTDEPMRTYIACRKEIAAYLSGNITWKLPSAVSGCQGAVEFRQVAPSQLKLSNKWMCNQK